jgi:hypothetical protein
VKPRLRIVRGMVTEIVIDRCCTLALGGHLYSATGQQAQDALSLKLKGCPAVAAVLGSEILWIRAAEQATSLAHDEWRKTMRLEVFK